MMTVSDYIPSNRLHEGIEMILQNAHNLVECAKILCKEEKYTIASVLSILAFEEMAKAMFLIDHYNKREGVSEAQWRKLTRGRVHRRKLEKFVRTEEPYKRYIAAKGINSRIEKNIEMMIKHYKETKEHSLYVDWLSLHADKDGSRKMGWSWLQPLPEPNLKYQKIVAHSFLKHVQERLQILKRSIPF
jgi:AbiV family abortive infection protein